MKRCDQEAVTGEKVECCEGQERPSAPDFVHHGARYEKAEEGPETQKCDCLEEIRLGRVFGLADRQITDPRG